jgi:hypothetical protein
MATIDIGKIKPVFKGTYDNSTAYVLDDIVYYNGSSYVAKTSTTGNLPTDATKWNVLAQGSGGIYDGSLSIGSANQVLAVNSGATALEFQTPASGKIKQVVYSNTNQSGSTTNTSYQDTGVTANITPNHANNLILIWATLGEPDQTDGRLNCHVHKGGSALTYGRLVSEMGRGLSNTGAETHRGSIGHCVVDVAGGTSQITYDLKYKSGNGGTVRFGNGGSSNIVLMEYEV